MMFKDKMNAYFKHIELQTSEVRAVLLDELLESATRSGTLDVMSVVKILMSCPLEQREIMVENFINAAEKLNKKKEKFRPKQDRFLPKNLRKSIISALDDAMNRKQVEIDQARVALGLIHESETHIARQALVREKEKLKEDKKTFSTTFSKSSARTFVQGGAPGLKR